jgi:hypothetical protein
MVYFQTKNPNLVLQWKLFVYFMSIGNILRPFGIFYGDLVHFSSNLVYFSPFGMMKQEKSGNPALISERVCVCV